MPIAPRLVVIFFSLGCLAGPSYGSILEQLAQLGTCGKIASEHLLGSKEGYQATDLRRFLMEKWWPDGLPRAEKGASIAAYLEATLPAAFKAEFSSEYQQVMRMLRTRLRQEEFDDLGPTSFGRFNDKSFSLSFNRLKLDKVTPVKVFLTARHELRHLISGETILDRIRLEFHPAMGRADFVAANLEKLALNEAISRYGDHLMAMRLLKSPELAPFALHILATGKKALNLSLAILAADLPPGKPTLAHIVQLILKDPHYHARYQERLERYFPRIQQQHRAGKLGDSDLVLSYE